MIVLALEQSSCRPSAVLLSDGAIRAHAEWLDDRTRRQTLFDAIPDLMRTAGCRLSDVDLFAVGLGPGAFSGLRMAVAAARAFALPGGRPVFGVSSAEALAWEHLRLGEPAVAVVGDARRDRLWLGVFSAGSDGLPEGNGFQLVSTGDWLTALPDRGLVASPDWDRIGVRLAEADTVQRRVLAGPASPTARQVAELAIARHARGTPSPPLAPIYLHPPVLAPPASHP
jgi:tRNA threonylcarbamoyladenosine biosynthesis protein TsaB